VVHAYDQGVAIAANLQMSKLAPTEAERRYYLEQAKETANATLHRIETRANWLWKQAPVFNAILFRNLLKLGDVTDDPRFRQALERYVARIEAQARSRDGFYVLGNIGHYGGERGTIDQAGIAQMFALLAMDREQLAQLT
jgi:hypothetical protein